MIKEFKGEYRWLSNFAACEIAFEGYTYASIEHAYVSAKSTEKAWKVFCSDSSNTAGKVKRKGRKVELRQDWDLIKVDVMRQLLELKFAQKTYKRLLLNTGDVFIQEGNGWGDSFWGVDLKTNIGENNLGILIMEIREQLLEEETIGERFYRSAVNLIHRLIN